MKFSLMVLVCAISFTAMVSHADDSIYLVNGKQGTKLDALTSLIKNKDSQVLKCQPQMITKKATLKKKGSDE